MKNSINKWARAGGLLYLVIIITGIFSVILVRGELVVSKDPAATAQNIMGSGFLWRLGLGAEILMHLCDIPLMVIMYMILRRVHKDLAMMVVLFNVVASAVLVANNLNLAAVLLPLQNVSYLQDIDPKILYEQAYLSIRLNDIGFGIGLIFFAMVCLLEGYLIYRSGFLPKAIGVLMFIAGVCYLVNDFLVILAPQFTSYIFMIPCFVAELSLALWLVFKGVDVEKWEQLGQ